MRPELNRCGIPCLYQLFGAVWGALRGAERQGADSNRPDVEARIAPRWQLGHAAVPPARIAFSVEHGERTAEVPAASTPVPYQAAFSAGATGTRHTDG